MWWAAQKRGSRERKEKKKIIENRCCCQRRCTSTSLEPRQSYRQDLSRRLIYSKNYSKLRYSLDFPFDYNFRALLCLSTFSLLFMFVIILKTLCCKPSRLFFPCWPQHLYGFRFLHRRRYYDLSFKFYGMSST